MYLQLMKLFFLCLGLQWLFSSKSSLVSLCPLVFFFNKARKAHSPNTIGGVSPKVEESEYLEASANFDSETNKFLPKKGKDFFWSGWILAKFPRFHFFLLELYAASITIHWDFFHSLDITQVGMLTNHILLMVALGAI